MLGAHVEGLHDLGQGQHHKRHRLAARFQTGVRLADRKRGQRQQREHHALQYDAQPQSVCKQAFVLGLGPAVGVERQLGKARVLLRHRALLQPVFVRGDDDRGLGRVADVLLRGQAAGRVGLVVTEQFVNRGLVRCHGYCLLHGMFFMYPA